MCTFLVLLISERADLEHATAVARSFGFEPGVFEGDPQLPRTYDGAVLLDPDGAHCHCGTSIGKKHREPAKLEKLERMARTGRRARWSEAKRRKWIEQQLAVVGTGAPMSPGAKPELDRWLALADAAGRDPRIGPIGVVVMEAHHRVSDWRPAQRVSASAEALQVVPRCTPVWLLPDAALAS